jgi:hypothetical protein
MKEFYTIMRYEVFEGERGSGKGRKGDTRDVEKKILKGRADNMRGDMKDMMNMSGVSNSDSVNEWRDDNI